MWLLLEVAAITAIKKYFQAEKEKRGDEQEIPSSLKTFWNYSDNKLEDERRAMNAQVEANKYIALQYEDKKRAARPELFKEIFKCSLSDLQEVLFDQGEDPIISFTLAKVESPMRIRFMDDSAREQWRRGLAACLEQDAAGREWQRQFNAGEGQSKEKRGHAHKEKDATKKT